MDHSLRQSEIGFCNSAEEAECGRILMVLFFDEAKTLVDTDYYNALRWVLDEVIPEAYTMEKLKRGLGGEKEPLPYIVMFLGTNSTVADFLPPDEDSSARFFLEHMTIPQPFTALDWDVNIGKEYRRGTVTYNTLAEMTWLARFGRPMWDSQWSLSIGEDAEERVLQAERILRFAEVKLHHRHQEGGFRNLFKGTNLATQKKDTDFVLTCSAILGVLAVLDLDFTSPKRAADLVASRLRWAAGCDQKRTYLLTCYPSEPILAEAASRLLFFNFRGNHHNVLTTILEVVATQINNGDYDFGGDGELAARLLCIPA
jgi:hypothetical protein